MKSYKLTNFLVTSPISIENGGHLFRILELCLAFSMVWYRGDMPI